jgi:hypothetical protein
MPAERSSRATFYWATIRSSATELRVQVASYMMETNTRIVELPGI